MPRDIPPVEPAPRPKWLNIVFDLNGVLCQTVFKSTVEKMKSYKVQDHVLYHRYPTIIGPKAVFARPNVGEFLREVSNIANRVVVWTSMMRRNAEPIAAHLFYGCKQPYEILGQENCTRIEVSKRKFFNLNGKDHCLKVLSESLFSNPTGTPFTVNNTLLIDDSPSKSVCNENGNAVFLDTWSHAQRRDDVLMGELLSWLRRLHSQSLNGDMRRYVEDNRIGMNPLSSSDSTMKKIVEAMRESGKVMGACYKLLGIGLVLG